DSKLKARIEITRKTQKCEKSGESNG
nr:hypothetical protein [Tanacetum cinerariifolium]